MCKVNLKYRNHKVFSFFCRFPPLPTSVPPMALPALPLLSRQVRFRFAAVALDPTAGLFPSLANTAASWGFCASFRLAWQRASAWRRTYSSQSVATVTDYRANCHGLSCQLTRFIVSTVTDFMQTMEEGLAGGPRPAIGQATTRVGGVGKNGHPPPPMAIFCHGLRYYLV